MKNVKLVLNCIVKNESKVIERMLESVYKHIDYWVIQDNGSNDGTENIIKKFFEDKNIPGFLYYEPWQHHGYNRNHSLQTCLASNHGCDYVLRMDADEILEVKEDFDWNIIKTKDAWNIIFPQASFYVHRSGIWKASLPWEFQNNKRHEFIRLKNNEIYTHDNLPDSIKYILKGGGKTWENPYKYFIDALELEKEMITKENDSDNSFGWYHIFYLAKSYEDFLKTPNTKITDKQKRHFAERSKFYYYQFIHELQPDYPEQTKLLNQTQKDYLYYALFGIGISYKFSGQIEKAVKYWHKCFEFDPLRNEALIKLCEYFFYNKNDISNTYLYSSIAIKNKYPFPKLRDCWVDKEDYMDTGWRALDFHSVSAYHMGYFEESKNSCQILLSENYQQILPIEQRNRIIENLNFAKQKLHQ